MGDRPMCPGCGRPVEPEDEGITGGWHKECEPEDDEEEKEDD